MAMICRMWRGFTAADRAHEYEDYLREELFPRLRATIAEQGYRGYHILRRPVGAEVEFTTLVWFDSLESIRSFAGDGFEQAVVTPRAASILTRWEPAATHHELAAGAPGF